MITGKNHIGNQLSAEGSKTFKTFDPISNTENSSIHYEEKLHSELMNFQYLK